MDGRVHHPINNGGNGKDTSYNADNLNKKLMPLRIF